MKILLNCFFGFSFIITFSFCQKPKTNNSESVHKEQLLHLLDSLNKNQVKLLKYLTKDNKKDTIFLNKVDWNKELSIFKNTLLSNKSLKDFKVKKHLTPRYKITEYISKNETEISKVLIKENSDGFTYDINFTLKNRLATIAYYLSINSKKGYLIQSYQKIPYSYSTRFRIEGFFK